MVPPSRNFLWRKLARMTMLFKIIFANPAVRLYGVIHVGRETRVVVIKHSDKNTMIFRHSARAWMFEEYRFIFLQKDGLRGFFCPVIPRVFQNYAGIHSRERRYCN